MKSLLVPLALASSMLCMPAPASAAWMGLPDGDYAVTLQCTFSSVLDCAQTLAGSITVDGAGLSAMDFSLNGETFSGDPSDGVVDGTVVDTEQSGRTNTPFSFLSLRLITAGSIDNFQTGDRWWVYCENVATNSCTPNTTGLWSARRVGTVDEPPALAVGALGLVAALGLTRRRRAATTLRPWPAPSSPVP